MPDKRLWPNILYIPLIFIICITIWHLTPSGPHSPPPKVVFSGLHNSSYAYPVETLPAHDYSHLIDLTNFTFTILNYPCKNAPLLLILVHSNPKNARTREVLRSTWARNEPRISVLFLMGVPEEPHLRVAIQQENAKYADVIQGSFVDAYRNMTYKHIMLFKYVVYHCPQAKYVLKTDDDVFVNTPAIINFLTMDLSPFGASRMLVCNLKVGVSVERTWRSKWRVSFKEYSAKTYPPYCPGWVILYSLDVVFDLYREAQVSHYFWIDDVHVTGTLAERLNITHKNVENLVIGERTISRLMQQPSAKNLTFLFGGADIKDEHNLFLWQYVHTYDAPTTLIKCLEEEG